MNKALIYIAVILGLWITGAISGVLWERHGSEKAIAREKDRYAQAMQQVAKNTIRRSKHAEETKLIIRKIKDPTGCFDTDWPADAVSRLRAYYRSQ